MTRNLPGYLAYGDITTHDSDPQVAHRPRKGRLARGPRQDRPAACPAGDDAPEQTGLRTVEDGNKHGLAGGFYPPLTTGWSELGAARAIQVLDMAPCGAEQCFPEIYLDGMP